MANNPTFITRVVLENYKSIVSCDVPLGPLVFLVGPNGSGESNFLDALHFVSDALRLSVEEALQVRGGLTDVLSRGNGPADHVGVRLDVTLPDGAHGHYSFRIAIRPGGGFTVTEEEGVVGTGRDGQAPMFFRVRDGEFDTNGLSGMPLHLMQHSPHSLYLYDADGIDANFGHLRDQLIAMGFFSISPQSLRRQTSIEPRRALTPDGSTAPLVLAQAANRHDGTVERIEDYLRAIVPEVRDVHPRYLPDGAMLEFVLGIAENAPERFLAPMVSDDALRAFGILLALFSATDEDGRTLSLIGIEEPEIGIHPGATAVLLDALREASTKRQILVTSHSSDLLDNKDLTGDAILAFASDRGLSRIGPLTEAASSMLRDHLYTAGELLRGNQAWPSPALISNGARADSRLFGE